LLRGFAHPDQEFIYCYKANCALLDQYTSLPDCRGFQTNPVSRIGKNSIGKFCEKLNKKAQIKNRHLFRNHCWRELGLGTIANNLNVDMAEQMAFSWHSNASSHIAYIRAGHNSDFSFQKAISGAPMPKKKEIVKTKSMATKVAKMAKTKLRKVMVVIRKTKPPKAPSYMKAPPKRLISGATRVTPRQSARASKPNEKHG
jgi:hypothetical protein